jgi:hypothetical protein
LEKKKDALGENNHFPYELCRGTFGALLAKNILDYGSKIAL